MQLNKEKIKLDNGSYDALWSAYRLTVLLPDNETYDMPTIIGVKGINCQTKIEVNDGDVFLIQ